MFYQLSHAGYEFIKTKIAKLNRIAVKLEQEQIQFELIKRDVKTDPKTLESETVYHIMCIGEAPKLKDWKFMATIDFTPKGNIFNTTYNYDAEGAKKIPERFRHTPFTLCEDCKVKRYRNRVFILWNDIKDKWMQVGSTCLGSFLGVKENEVHELAEFATTLASMSSAVKKWDDKAKNSKKNLFYTGYKMEDMVTAMFASVSKEYKANPSSSWNIKCYIGNALYRVQNRFSEYLKLASKKDVDNAKKMVKFFSDGLWLAPKSWSNKQEMFNKNTAIVMKNLVINRRHYKFLVNAFESYMRNEGKDIYKVVTPQTNCYQVKYTPIVNTPNGGAYAVNMVPVAPAPVKVSVPLPTFTHSTEYIGKVGERMDLNLPTTVTFVDNCANKWARPVPMILTDAKGNKLFWNCPYLYRVNDRITVRSANIIRHYDELSGDKRTEIGAVTFQKH